MALRIFTIVIIIVDVIIIIIIIIIDIIIITSFKIWKRHKQEKWI